MKSQQYFENMKFFCLENRKLIVDCGFKGTSLCPQTCYYAQEIVYKGFVGSIDRKKIKRTLDKLIDGIQQRSI